MKRVHLLLVLFGACRLFDSDRGSGLLELRLQQRIWASKNIRDYQFDLATKCFCAPDSLHIEVIDGVVFRTVRLSPNNPSTPEGLNGSPTIDSLFAITERRITQYGYRIEASYDPTYGFPTRIAGDIPRALDDEFVQTVSNFALAARTDAR